MKKILKIKFTKNKCLKQITSLAVIPLLTACATPYATMMQVDYSYQKDKKSPKVIYESYHGKQVLKFAGGSAKSLVEKAIGNGYFLAFADSNHYEPDIRQEALNLVAHTRLRKVGIELPKDVSLRSRVAYNNQFSYLSGLQPVAVDVKTEKRLQLTNHPSYKYAYGAINHLKYKSILKAKKIGRSDLECEFVKYRMAESDVEITKNVIGQQLDAMIFGISHFTYRLGGQPAGIDNHLEKAGRKVVTIAIVAANPVEYGKLKSHFPNGDLVFTNGLADIDYTMIIPAKTKAVDKLGSFYDFYDQQGKSINVSNSFASPPRCSGLVPRTLVRL